MSADSIADLRAQLRTVVKDALARHLHDDDLRHTEVPVYTAWPVEVVWSFRFVAYLVRWHGFIHGGCHFVEGRHGEHGSADAITHAQELATLPIDQQNEWRASYGMAPMDAADYYEWLEVAGYGR